MMRRALTLLAAVGLLAGAVAVSAPATAAPAKAATALTVPTHATYPGCDQTMPLNDHWSGANGWTDDIRSVNSIGIKTGWGVSPYVTTNGSSSRGYSGMYWGPTNINIGTRDFVYGVSIKTNDTKYNSAQFGNNPVAGGGGVGVGNPGFVKLTGVYTTLVGELDTVKLDDLGIGDDPTNPTRAVPASGDPYSDNHNTDNTTQYLCVQRIGGVLSYYVNGFLQESSTVDVGPINLNGTDTPLQVLGKFQPGIGYDADDQCGVTRISTTNHNALMPPTRNCQEWNMQLGTRVVP